MRRLTRSWLALAIVAAAATAGAILLITGGDDEGTGGRTASPATRSAAPSPAAPKPRPTPPPKSRDGNGIRAGVKAAVRESKPARLDPEQRRVAAVIRGYVRALNARDGRRACRLFVPGALSGVDFPRDRGSCAASLSASVGYRDPRGFPVYDGSRVARISDVAVKGSDARVTATVVTRFAGGREPSVEDDLIYLRRAGSNWLIVKPSATLYRAIGVGIIPPQAISPP